MKWTREKLISEYLNFFKSKGHAVIENAQLVPREDPTVLFTTAGMHPLVPFLLGQKHPRGKRLCNVQKCIRTTDIEEVGDECHHTFFEMLGNWSLGDYWKKEAIEMSFEFLTKILKLPVEKLAVSCFKGDKDAKKDEEATEIWKSLGIKNERIAFLPKEDNWWGPAGKTGPCGPDTEMFFYAGKKVPNKFKPEDKKWVEIWNDVFMQYNKVEKGNYNPAKQKNVDTGMGVERTLAVLQRLDDNYKTELFLPIIQKIEKLSNKKYGKDIGETRAIRIIADHVKASVFILAENIEPSNIEQGYVLRRLIRRAVRYGKELGINVSFVKQVAEQVIEIYKNCSDYSNLDKNKTFILSELEKEEQKFLESLEKGLKVAEKILKSKIPIKKEKFIKLMQLEDKRQILSETFRKKRLGKKYSIKEVGISEEDIDNATVSGKEAFYLYQSFGFPIEMITELVREKCLFVPHSEFRKELEKHQELSRTATKGKFKSGLADESEKTTRLHTAAHLLLATLRQILSKEIMQKGSNITEERLRLDFNFPRKLIDDELKKAEKLVNEKIKQSLQVKREEMSLEQAKSSGALGVFEHKYGDKVSVYSVGNFSKEICAGPHVKNTQELGKFKIIKEESVASGIRRIKAVLE